MNDTLFKEKLDELIEAIGDMGGSIQIDDITADSFVGDLTKGSTDLVITAAAAKDILMKLGDHAGAKSFKVTTDQADVVVTIDSGGEITATSFNGDVIKTSAADLALNAAASQDVAVKLGDNAGANKLLITDSDAVTVASIDSNGGIVAPTAEFVTITAKAASDLGITADSDQDIVVKMGDALGAKAVKFNDSANVTKAMIDSDGIITGTTVKAPLPTGTGDTSGAPTNAELDAAFGSAATVGAGYAVHFADSHAGGKRYLCISNGTTWDTFEGTAGA